MMEIQVVKGDFRHGSILSLRVGDTRRQAPLSSNTRILFPRPIAEVRTVQVDVFNRIVSTRLLVNPEKEVYELPIGTEGFSALQLHVRASQEEVDSKGEKFGASRSIDDYVTGQDPVKRAIEDATEYVERYDLRTVLQNLFQQVIKEKPGDPFAFMRGCLGAVTPVDDSGASPQEASAVRQEKDELVEEVKRLQHQLGQAQEQHENEKRKLLDAHQLELDSVSASRSGAGVNSTTLSKEGDLALELERCQVANAELRRQLQEALEPQPAVVREPLTWQEQGSAEVTSESALPVSEEARSQQEEQRLRAQLLVAEEAIARLQQEVKAAAQEASPIPVEDSRKYEEELAELQRQVSESKQEKLQLQRRIEDYEGGDVAAKVKEHLQDLLRASEESKEAVQRQLTSVQQERTVLMQRLEKYEQGQASQADVMKSHLDVQDRLTKRVSDAEEQNGTLAGQLKSATQAQEALVSELQSAMSDKEMLSQRLSDALALAEQRAAAGREAAGLKQSLEAERQRATAAEASLAKARAEVAKQSREAALAKTADAASAAAAPSLAMTNTAEVNTHMLASIVGSSYAAPVPPATYFEPGDDEADEAELQNKPKSNPELLVAVVDCQDRTTNGTFAWVGDLGSRPLYRLLGSEPRYLYYAEVDPTWAGWWIADKLGSQDYVEWFKEPHDARLPIYCSRGELGSRVIPQHLTREVVQKLALISNHHEKVTIRSKLIEEFGSMVTKLEGTQRGLMSKTSPVVGIAHALEAQQRAIQLLHSQLAAETQRREAAEAHSQTMEEAFETLQLRISMQLPNVQALPS